MEPTVNDKFVEIYGFFNDRGWGKMIQLRKDGTEVAFMSDALPGIRSIINHKLFAEWSK